ncbi:MAG: hypothetical protein AAFU65_09185, partial [Pseudomonadota bacterium]
MSIRHITALIIVALGPAVQAADKSILFQVGESYEGIGVVIGVSDNIGAARETTASGPRHIACFGIRTEDGEHPLVTYDVDSRLFRGQFGVSTLLGSGDIMQVQFSCDTNAESVVVSGLLGDFVTQSYVMQALDDKGAPDGPPELLLKSGDPLPNGASFSFA